MFRHDDIGPQVEPMRFSCPIDGIDHPLPGAVLRQERLAAEAGERQGMGMPGLIPAFTPLSMAVHTPDSDSGDAHTLRMLAQGGKHATQLRLEQANPPCSHVIHGCHASRFGEACSLRPPDSRSCLPQAASMAPNFDLSSPTTVVAHGSEGAMLPALGKHVRSGRPIQEHPCPELQACHPAASKGETTSAA